MYGGAEHDRQVAGSGAVLGLIRPVAYTIFRIALTRIRLRDSL